MKNVAGQALSMVPGGGGPGDRDATRVSSNVSKIQPKFKNNSPFAGIKPRDLGTIHAPVDYVNYQDIGLPTSSLAVSQNVLNGYSIAFGLPAIRTLSAEIYTAVKTVGNFEVPVYRVWGGGASMYGKSYSLFNPEYIPNYRNFAGLPTTNSGENLLKGSVFLRDIKVGRMFAAPLDGNMGGLPFEFYQKYNQLIKPVNTFLKNPFNMFGIRKNNEIDTKAIIDEKENFLNILKALAEQLEKSGNNAQSKFILKLIYLLDQNNFPQFVNMLNGVEMWGGSGAVWEVYIENVREETLFQKEIVKLISLMEKVKIMGGEILAIKRLFANELKR